MNYTEEQTRKLVEQYKSKPSMLKVEDLAIAYGKSVDNVCGCSVWRPVSQSPQPHVGDNVQRGGRCYSNQGICAHLRKIPKHPAPAPDGLDHHKTGTYSALIGVYVYRSDYLSRREYLR